MGRGPGRDPRGSRDGQYRRRLLRDSPGAHSCRLRLRSRPAQNPTHPSLLANAVALALHTGKSPAQAAELLSYVPSYSAASSAKTLASREDPIADGFDPLPCVLLLSRPLSRSGPPPHVLARPPSTRRHPPPTANCAPPTHSTRSCGTSTRKRACSTRRRRSSSLRWSGHSTRSLLWGLDSREDLAGALTSLSVRTLFLFLFSLVKPAKRLGKRDRRGRDLREERHGATSAGPWPNLGSGFSRAVFWISMSERASEPERQGARIFEGPKSTRGPGVGVPEWRVSGRSVRDLS